jgi:hypothetical protein
MDYFGEVTIQIIYFMKTDGLTQGNPKYSTAHN